MHISTQLAGLGILIGTYLISKIVYNIFLSPLHKIPGPFLAKFTQSWLQFHDILGNRTKTIHKSHKKYGYVVRIGPNELSFSHPSVVKEIYSQQTEYMKAPIYDGFAPPPAGIFTMRIKQDHRERRRLLSNPFSLSSLYSIEPLLHDRVEKLVARIEGEIGHAFDVMVGFRMFALDVIGELFFGQSFGALESPQPPQFVHDLDSVLLVYGVQALLGPWLFPLAARLPSKKWQDLVAGSIRYRERGANAFKDYLEKYGNNSQRNDLLARLVNPPDKHDRLSDAEISHEMSNLVHAGTDTTSTTLMYLFWELAHDADLQQRLREELVTAIPSQKSPDYKSLVTLPLLDAVVNEALRKHAAAPSSLFRETPKGGRELCGYFIPEGTVVSMQAYTTHRDIDFFPNPEKFDPDRWINADEAELSRMKEMFMPFSKGTRNCIGSHLALMELKLVTAALVSRYTMTVAPTMKESDMDTKDHFLIMTTGDRCELVFERVEAS